MFDPDSLDQPSPSAKPKPNNRRTLLIIAALGLIFTCAACAIISLLLPDSNSATESTARPTDAPSALVQTEETAASTNQATEAPSATAEPTTAPAATETTELTPTIRPTNTLQPTSAPQPTDTTTLPNTGELRDLTPDELALQNTIDQALGESNRGRGRKLDLFSPGLPGFMENSIIIGWAADDADTPALVRESMARDTLTVLRAVADSGLDYDAVLIGSKYPMMIEQLNMVDELEILTLAYNRDTLAAINWNTITLDQIFDLADLFIIHPDFEQ